MSDALRPGSPAPSFCLPGVDGATTRIYRLAECLRDGPALLAFVPDGNGRPLRAARRLSWFDIIDGVTPLVVSEASCATRERTLQGGTAPLLGDSRRSVGASYGVDYDRASLFLVDATRTIRGRWTTSSVEELDLTAVKEGARHANETTTTPIQSET